MYKRCTGNKLLIVGVYVDDLIVTRTSREDILVFKEQMKRDFEMSDIGTLSYYLSLEVQQNCKGISLN